MKVRNCSAVTGSSAPNDVSLTPCEPVFVRIPDVRHGPAGNVGKRRGQRLVERVLRAAEQPHQHDDRLLPGQAAVQVKDGVPVCVGACSAEQAELIQCVCRVHRFYVCGRDGYGQGKEAAQTPEKRRVIFSQVPAPLHHLFTDRIKGKRGTCVKYGRMICNFENFEVRDYCVLFSQEILRTRDG